MANSNSVPDLHPDEMMQPPMSRESMHYAQSLLFARSTVNAAPRNYDEELPVDYIPAMLKYQAC